MFNLSFQHSTHSILLNEYTHSERLTLPRAVRIIAHTSFNADQKGLFHQNHRLCMETEYDAVSSDVKHR